MKQKRLASALLCMVMVLLIPVCAFAADSVPQKILDLRSSVVRVVGQNVEGTPFGTGFPLGVDGVQYIATNYHVVEDTNNIKVLYGSKDSVSASIAAKLPGSDLCVLKLDNPIPDMVPMTLDDQNDAKPGDAVFALGFPGSADRLFASDFTASVNEVTVTSGIISSLRSSTMMQGGNEVGLYQIDVAINHGNSGGPLLNKAGEVIGINAYGDADAQNVNAAIRIDELTDLLKQNNIPYRTPGEFSANWLFITILAGIAAAAVLTVVLVLRRVRRRGKMPKGKVILLETWLMNAGGRVPFETALYMLEPAMRRLAAMHANGMSHLHIGMDSILMQANGLAMLAEDKLKSGAPQGMKPGFAAPEQYRTGGDIGPWCDVYATGALLYRMVTGKPLPDAFSRMEYDADVQQDIAGRSIDENKKAAWIKALSLRPEERFHNCGILAQALYAPGSVRENMEDTPEAPVGVQPAAPWAGTQNYAYGQAQPNPKKKFKKRWIAVIIVGVFAIAAGGYFGFVEYTYQQAVQQTDNGFYQLALSNLEKLPTGYKDAISMDRYDFACQQLKQSNFDTAKEWFQKLGDYRDSNTMITEVEYRRAKTDLANLKWDQAKSEFTALGDYKDAKIMITQVDYERASKLIKDKNILDAYTVFKTIPNYADVPEILPALQEAVYEQAVQDYRQGDAARESFEALSGYKDANAYLTLVDAKVWASQQKYEELIKLAGFEDAIDVIMNDEYIFYYLKGNWSDGNGNYFQMREDKHTTYNIPWYDGEYYDIQNAVYKVGPAGNENKNVFKFNFVSPNEIVVYDYKNNRMYQMVRQ